MPPYARPRHEDHAPTRRRPGAPVRFLAFLTLFFVGLSLLAGVLPAKAQEAARTIDLIHLEGIIDPTQADYLTAKLDAAQQDGVHAVVIQLDTPGGLDVSMRTMIRQVLDSDVPVIVWVAPRGARAASAGTFLAYSAHRIYMAEATEMGAATPIDLSGSDLEAKVTNDAAAFITELARTRDRNEEWAESAVREGAAIGATEAVEIGVADGMASSLGDLLRAMDGERIELGVTSDDAAPARTVTLDTWDDSVGTPSVTVRFQQMNVLQRLLHAVTNPEIAYFLLLVGFYGIIFELYNPGIGLAGMLGGVSLLLGFYGLSVLPTNWVGVLLIAAAIIFFIVDLQVAGFGVWTAGGIAALVVGGLILFSGADPELQVAPWAIGTAVVGSLLFFVSIMTAALRVRLRRPVTGEESMVGTMGEATTDIAPEGMVMTKGALWRARTMEMGIAAGSKVEVKATEGLVLLVEPLHDHGGEHDEGPGNQAEPGAGEAADPGAHGAQGEEQDAPNAGR
jgi:membrane-bound serine protease (ClpP class)